MTSEYKKNLIFFTGDDSQGPETSQHIFGFQWPSQNWRLWPGYYKYHKQGTYLYITYMYQDGDLEILHRAAEDKDNDILCIH